MFCLRSWLPLLFIPTNASPLFIISFVTLTYVLHRPCIYCSALLLILFISSCHWSDRCFFDLHGDWFSPRFTSPSFFANDAAATTLQMANNSSMSVSGGLVGQEESLAGYVLEAVNTTTKALAGAAVEEAQRRLAFNNSSNNIIPNNGTATVAGGGEWTGIGLEWLRSLLGRREWTLPCVDVKVRL